MQQDDERIEELDDEVTTRPGWQRAVARVLLAVVLIALGAAGGVIWAERRASPGAAPRPAPSAPGPEQASGASPGGIATMTGMATGTAKTEAKADEPVEVSLTPDAVERAGIKTAVARTDTAKTAVTVPGTVTPNAYRDTRVNALAGGVVRQVTVELGSPVDRGQPLAVIFSAELAEAQMKYLSMRAMLGADHQKKLRTEKLVALGAASRQELEEVRAVHEARETEVAAARQRLLLLGLTAEQVTRLTGASHVVSDATVAAPAGGVIVTRGINPGQVVSAGQEMFAVTDLATVWVIGDVYEKDLARVPAGAEATVTLPSAPDRPAIRGRVDYIDPRVDAATRTAKLRVEVPNRERELRLGMFVTVTFDTGPGERVTLVPAKAVQSIGERTVVYVLTAEEGRFAERTVKLGAVAGDAVQVVDGLKPGERVVTEGSFFLRAEAARTRSGG